MFAADGADHSSPVDGAEFLDRVGKRTAAVVVLGPAGIGKTFWWNRLVLEAETAGFRVMRASPSQAEARLFGSALIDLCAGVSDEEISRLPGAQADVLRAALLRGERDQVPRDSLALAVAVTSLIRSLGGPLLIAVDDIQWVDGQTTEVLAFAVRRLPQSGVALALSLRSESGVPSASVTELMEPIPTEWAVVRPLAAAAIERLITSSMDPLPPKRLVKRIVDACGGNPLFAMELAHTAAANPGADDLVLSPTLSAAVGHHIADLAEATRDAVAAVAALRRPTLAQLSALQLEDALPPAERANVVVIDGGDVRFTHPMLAAAAYDSLTGTERTRLHARLAGVADGPEERARHLALGSDRPDAAVARALDTATERALARGAVAAALDSARLAVHATPGDDADRPQRRLRLGVLLSRVGETERAHAELSNVLRETAPQGVQARAMYELSRIAYGFQSPGTARELALAALALCEDDAELAADLHTRLADLPGDMDDCVGHAETAVALLKRLPQPRRERLASAVARAAELRFAAGKGIDHAAFQDAINLEAGTLSAPVTESVLATYGSVLHYGDESARAREMLLQAREQAERDFDEASLIFAANVLSQLELWAGRWDDAEAYAVEALHLAQRAGLEGRQRRGRFRMAAVQAARGRFDEAIPVAEEHIRAAAEGAGPEAELFGRTLLGYCSLVAGRAEVAAQELGRVMEITRSFGRRDPGFTWIRPYYIEALVAIRELDQAADELAEYQSQAEAVGRRSALAAAARCRALLAAARGDTESATAAAAESVRRWGELDRPFDRARALVTLGMIYRRGKQKAAARETLNEALAVFAELGAEADAEHARAELSRISLRPPASTELTHTERRVAELAAQGSTSAEIAAALFMSGKTVEGNLTRVYRKLGVRNRTELSSRLLGHRD